MERGNKEKRKQKGRKKGKKKLKRSQKSPNIRHECGWFTRSQPYLSPQMPPDTKINRTGEVIAPCGEVTQPSGQVTLPH
jgi:hypothetical protein